MQAKASDERLSPQRTAKQKHKPQPKSNQDPNQVLIRI